MASVLFVCFGNKCRSPMAQAILLHLLREQEKEGWKVDSAGHGDWHIGETPEPRALHVLSENGIEGFTHIARMITNEDYLEFDYIFCMDDYNLRNLKGLEPAESKCHIYKLGDFDPEGVKVIFDPYFSDSIAAYEEVYRQCYRCCKAFLSHVLSH